MIFFWEMDLNSKAIKLCKRRNFMFDEYKEVLLTIV